jgi:hypothetical protein
MADDRPFAVNRIPVPHGWTYRLAPEDLPSVERDVGAYTLTVSLDDGSWVWWLCPRGEGLSIRHGEGADQQDAIFAALGALMGVLSATDAPARPSH